MFSNPTEFEVLVTGESMWPRLIPGQTYPATVKTHRPIMLGDVVVFRHPARTADFFVKQVIAIHKDKLTVTGTNSWSSTWRLPRSAILGTIRLTPLSPIRNKFNVSTVRRGRG